MLATLEGTHRAEHLGDVLHGDVVLRQPLNKDPVLTHSSHWFFPQSLFRNSFGEKIAALVLHVTQSHVVLCLKHILLVALAQAAALPLRALASAQRPCALHACDASAPARWETWQCTAGWSSHLNLCPSAECSSNETKSGNFFSADGAASTNFCRNQPFLLYLVKLKFVKKV